MENDALPSALDPCMSGPIIITSYVLSFPNSDEICDDKICEALQDRLGQWKLKYTGAGCLMFTHGRVG